MLKGATIPYDRLHEIGAIMNRDMERRKEVSEITFPSGAATIAIPVGTTELDLWTGAVFFGDGSTDQMNDALENMTANAIRSIYVSVSKAYTVEVDGKADHAMAANDALVEAGISCSYIAVTVTEAANLKFWGSTNPNATLRSAKAAVTPSRDEIQVFSDEAIRVVAAHDSLIANYASYTSVTFYIENGLDKDISARVYGNRVNSVTGAVTIGDAFTVSTADETAKSILASATGMMPYMFVRLTPTVIPTSGVLNVYAICRYTT